LNCPRLASRGFHRLEAKKIIAFIQVFGEPRYYRKTSEPTLVSHLDNNE